MSTLTIDALRTDRPLLARVADSIYWTSRYIERVEHVARVLKITTNLLMDVGDLSPVMQERQWLSILRLTGGGFAPEGTTPLGYRVGNLLAFDPHCEASIFNCIGSARENARAVRSEISAEMWEHLNSLYWRIRSDDARRQFQEQPEEFYNSVMLGSMLYQGLCDQTLAHDQRWHFALLARSLERIDMTCRILEARLRDLEGVEHLLEAPLRNIQWMSVLRMCCSIEAYRRQFGSDLDPDKVIALLILDDNFPRTLCYNLTAALRSIEAIRQATTPTIIDPAERLFGRLAAELFYGDPAELTRARALQFLAKMQRAVSQAGAFVQQSYFLK